MEVNFKVQTQCLNVVRVVFLIYHIYIIYIHVNMCLLLYRSNPCSIPGIILFDHSSLWETTNAHARIKGRCSSARASSGDGSLVPASFKSLPNELVMEVVIAGHSCIKECMMQWASHEIKFKHVCSIKFHNDFNIKVFYTNDIKICVT